jgi:transcriptional antiterminator NusG
MKWYVVHTYSGQENNVKKHLEIIVSREGLQDQIGHILVPSQDVVSVSRGKKINRNRKFFPSYIIVEMEMNKDTMHLVTDIPGVTHFVGTDNKPQAIRKSEVERLLGQVNPGNAEEKILEIPFLIGDSVRIKDGPFKDFDGSVEDVNTEKGKLKVMVSVFGRSTPVELGFMQVEAL